MRVLRKGLATVGVLLVFGLACAAVHAQTAQLAGPTRGSTLQPTTYQATEKTGERLTITQ